MVNSYNYYKETRMKRKLSNANRDYSNAKCEARARFKANVAAGMNVCKAATQYSTEMFVALKNFQDALR